MSPAAVSECREPSGVTLSNMILLADLTPSSAFPLDCGSSADESVSNKLSLKEILKVVCSKLGTTSCADLFWCTICCQGIGHEGKKFSVLHELGNETQMGSGGGGGGGRGAL